MGKFIIISGDDDYKRKERAKAAAQELCSCDDPENDPAIEIIPGDSPELKLPDLAGRFLNALRTPPFLCDHKVVWMRHHPDLDSWNGDRPPAVVTELLTFLAEPLPPELAVLIDGPGIDRRKAIYKMMKNAGAEMEFHSVAKSGDRNFAETRRALFSDFAANSGKRIAPDAVQYLTDVISGDSGILSNELEKLACYVGDAPEITLEDCLKIVSRTPEALSWEYTSAVTSGDRQGALRILGILLSQREQGLELRVLAGLSNEYQRMMKTAMAMKELGITRPSPRAFDGITEEQKEKFPNNPLIKMHPFRAFKVCEQAAKLDGRSLAAKLTLIRNTSRALVSGGGDSRILLETLTIKLASPRSR